MENTHWIWENATLTFKESDILVVLTVLAEKGWWWHLEHIPRDALKPLVTGGHWCSAAVIHELLLEPAIGPVRCVHADAGGSDGIMVWKVEALVEDTVLSADLNNCQLLNKTTSSWTYSSLYASHCILYW